MYKFKLFTFLWFALVLLSICDARGGGRGGGGGRSGGRSSGRSSSGSRRGSVSSSSSISSGRGYSGSHASGGSGWFHGFFHSTPQYTYHPIIITRSGSGSSSGSHYYTPKEEYTSSNDDSYAIGYTISRGLSGDFFSLFNMVRGISKYPDKIRNSEITQTTTTTTSTTTTTTESPITYNKNNFMYDYEDLNTILENSFRHLNGLEKYFENFSATQPTQS